MAKDNNKYVLEREYNVPLRKEWLKIPRYKRSKKATSALKEFLAKHMKVEDRDTRKVKIGKFLNEFIWKHGIKNPPHHVKVITKKNDKGITFAELEDKFDITFSNIEEKEEKTTKKTEKKEDKKENTVKEEKEEKAKKIEKEELELAKKETETIAKDKDNKEPIKEKEVEEKPTAPYHE